MIETHISALAEAVDQIAAEAPRLQAWGSRLAEVLSHDNAIRTMLSSTDFVSIDCALDMSPQRQTAMDRLAIRTRPRHSAHFHTRKESIDVKGPSVALLHRSTTETEEL